MAKVDKKDVTVLTAHGIEHFHVLLEKELSAILGFTSTIEEESNAYDREDWQRSRGPVSFVLREQKGTERMRTVADPENGRRQVALRLEPDPNGRQPEASLNWWVGWCEEWQPRGQTERAGKYEFTFRSASWRLYCTDEDDQDALLVRAEWHHQADEGVQRNGAQPHWHVHHQQKIGAVGVPLMVELTGTTSATPDEDVLYLDEQVQLQTRNEPMLTVPPIRHITIRDIHLGMGGWHNKGEHRKCWQFSFGDDLQGTLRAWAVATLEYMRSQLCYVHLAEAV